MRRGTLQRKTPLARGTSTLARGAIKKRKPKKRPGHDPKMLAACRDQHCYLRIPGVCLGDIAPTVPCHQNEGKGMGLKTPDERTVPGCNACHYEYDQGNKFTREEKRGFFNAAYQLWAIKRDGEKNVT